MTQYKNQGSWTIKLDDLRGLVSLQPREYKNYRMFEKKNFILLTKELWEHCGLHFEWEIAQK